jgi:hypothetical protein
MPTRHKSAPVRARAPSPSLRGVPGARARPSCAGPHCSRCPPAWPPMPLLRPGGRCRNRTGRSGIVTKQARNRRWTGSEQGRNRGRTGKGRQWVVAAEQALNRQRTGVEQVSDRLRRHVQTTPVQPYERGLVRTDRGLWEARKQAGKVRAGLPSPSCWGRGRGWGPHAEQASGTGNPSRITSWNRYRTGLPVPGTGLKKRCENRSRSPAIVRRDRRSKPAAPLTQTARPLIIRLSWPPVCPP